MATIAEQINTDIITAMKAREEDKLTTLRMVKAALRSREIDKREPLSGAEQQAILTTLLKQRRESIEQFSKGGRPELAAKEQVEIAWIEAYLPKAVTADDLRPLVIAALAELQETNGGRQPGPRDIGAAMKLVQARIAAADLRADGKTVSELLKAELAKGA